jgi:hypothetical protein
MSDLTDGQDAMPQYAGKKLKLAQVVVQLANGRPAQIARIYGTYLSFDQAGKADKSFEDVSRAALEMMDSVERFERNKSAKVVSLAPKLRQRRYERDHRWRPSRKDIEIISQARFEGSKKGPRKHPS